MNDDPEFRTVLIVGLLVVLPIAVYHRLKSQATGEHLDRRQEGLFILWTLRPVGIAAVLGLIAYTIDPSWMAWSSVPLPTWLRRTGVGLGAMGAGLLIWTLRTLGKNLTDTVVTRREHYLVTSGPYRFVRHPFYDAVAVCALAVCLIAANGFLFLTGGLVLLLLIVRTRTEEEKLLARFGDAYSAYAERTGRFLPRMRATRPLTSRLALITGILGTLAVVLLTVLGGTHSPNYSHASQFISELGASGAPNARLINLAGFLPAGLLISAFTFFAWRSLPRSRATTLGMLGLALFALGYVAAALFPCAPGCRPEQPSLSQAMHNLLGLAGYVTAPLSLFTLGWAARRWSKATYVSALGFIGGGLALLSLPFLSPDFRYVGVAQRVLEGSVLSWVVVCALYITGASSAKA